MRSEPDDFLPLKPVVFQVLLSLADADRHGYGIVQDIATRTAARMQLKAGNLYGSLREMLEAGLIVEAGTRPAADLDDERRRYYRITPFGRKVAAAEASRLADLVRDARVRLIKGRT